LVDNVILELARVTTNLGLESSDNGRGNLADSDEEI